MASDKGFTCTKGGDECGFGTCVGNGTLCACNAGYDHDELITGYVPCVMPTWTHYTFLVTFIVLSSGLFFTTIWQWRHSIAAPTQLVLAGALFATLSCVVFGVGSLALSSSPNPLIWALYFLMMAMHMCGLIPLCLRHIIPSSFHMIFLYPRWFDLATIIYFGAALSGLTFTWVYSMVALSYGNFEMFNTGVNIWYSVCIVLDVILTSVIYMATRQLIQAADSLIAKPFYRDLSVLRRRSILFQRVALCLGISSGVVLLATVILHFEESSAIKYHYIPTWVLLMLLCAADAVVIWFASSGSSKNAVSLPNSTLVLDDLEMDDRSSGRPTRLSFTKNGGIVPERRRRASSLFGKRLAPENRFVEMAVV